MYRVTAWFKDKKISQEFHNVLDAIEYREHLDAHYIRVVWRSL